MICAPSTIQELREHLVRANAEDRHGLAFDLAAFNRVLEHTPEDLTVTVQAGLTLVALQEQLARCGQWLPIDPPHPQIATIADILNNNASGPRRFGYGTIREHLLGLKVVLADGRLVSSGGKVVKNVAGYDLCKLFVGSHGSLGVIVEATFKVRPLPEAERIVSAHCESLPDAARLLEAIHDSELTPVVLDLQNAAPPLPTFQHLVLGLAGTREEVDWQLNKAAALGLNTPATLEYEQDFWTGAEAGPIHRLSVLPSRTTEVLDGLRASQFVARAGNGVIYYRGGNAPSKPELPRLLMQRIKDAYDPKHLLANEIEF